MNVGLADALDSAGVGVAGVGVIGLVVWQVGCLPGPGRG